MPTLFEKARDWLPRKTQAAAGVEVTYTRVGGGAQTLTAVPGRTVFATNVEGGAKIQWGDGDFLIVAADLAGGAPKIGDTIALTLSDAAALFEVAEPATGEPHWRYSDPQQKQYRVHCKWKKPT